MTISQVKEELKQSDHPVSRTIHSGKGVKISAVGLKKGMKIKEHKAPIPTKLIVLEGVVSYKEEHKVLELKQYHEVVVSAEMLHSVEAIDDSVCLLIKGE